MLKPYSHCPVSSVVLALANLANLLWLSEVSRDALLVSSQRLAEDYGRCKSSTLGIWKGAHALHSLDPLNLLQSTF